MKKKISKWKKDYETGKSYLNPNSKNFMKIIEIPSKRLYRTTKDNTKLLIVIDQNKLGDIKTLTLTTKDFNNKYKNYNIELNSKWYLDNTKAQYVDPNIRDKDRRKENINIIGKKITTKKISKEDKEIIKAGVDKYQYNKAINDLFVQLHKYIKLKKGKKWILPLFSSPGHIVPIESVLRLEGG